jgi:hypothetical protein
MALTEEIIACLEVFLANLLFQPQREDPPMSRRGVSSDAHDSAATNYRQVEAKRAVPYCTPSVSAAKRLGCAEQYSSKICSAVSLGGISDAGSSSGPTRSKPFIEAAVTKSGSPNNPLVCRYCGLETAVPHAGARDCIDALERERNRLREQLLQRRPGDTAVSGPTSIRDDARALSRRLHPVR